MKKCKTVVCHCKKSIYDVYIGRGCNPITGKLSKWGNPFVVGKDGTRQECIDKYAEWIQKQPHLISCLSELKGKRLGCWCRPLNCHGDILVELIEKLDSEKIVEKTLFDD